MMEKVLRNAYLKDQERDGRVTLNEPYGRGWNWLRIVSNFGLDACYVEPSGNIVGWLRHVR